METPQNQPAPGATNVYVQAAPPVAGNGMATASLVLGIISLVLVLIPLLGTIAWITAPLGLIFGFIGLGKPTGKGMAIGGLITSGLSLLIALSWVLFLGALLTAGAAAGSYNSF